MHWKINLGAIILTACSCSPQSNETADKELEYANPWSLIEPEELNGRSENTVLIDVRKPAEFLEGHIVGAVNVWRDQITDTSYSYGGMMATKNQMENLLRSLGVASSDTIILYDAKADVDAARLWWILNFYGHDNARLLNGGLKAWQGIGGELVSTSEETETSDFEFSGQEQASIHASINEVEKASTEGSAIILDTRSTKEYSGEKLKNGAAWPGRIPTAINLDWPTSVDYSGDHRFLGADSLKKLYEVANESLPVITYCHSGVRSAHTLFVLTELIGHKSVRNYDGSWTEWSHLNPASETTP